jgi:energy-coupling factor transporter ATP-binding protein EcfA2
MKSPDFILIDEPELGLHPALQREFLKTLTSYAKAGTLFATHSIGLTRSLGNQVYSFRRSERGLSSVAKYEATPYLPEFLGELSFSGYQELGFDTVLLVEGVTEVPTFLELLRLYGKDRKVVTVPMGGDQFINGKASLPLEELKRITPNISVLIDSERSSANATLMKNRREFAEVCMSAGVACTVSKRRALENYFPDCAIKRMVGEQFRAPGEFEAFNSTTNWGRSNNWRIAAEMIRDDLNGTDLGDFLESL